MSRETEGESPEKIPEVTPTKPQPKKGLEALLEEKGLDASDLIGLIEALGSLKKRDQSKEKEEEKAEKKVYKDKEFVFNTNQDVFIYRRGETAGGNYYVRIYDSASQKIHRQSLKTSNNHHAHVLAREIYLEKKDKLKRGVKMNSLTTKELIEYYLERKEKVITDVPHRGITTNSFKVIKQQLTYWERFIISKGHENTKIEKIPPEVGGEFRYWMLNLPKEFYKDTARSNEVINQCITRIKNVYKEVAIKEKFISLDILPAFERLKKERDVKPKRDILEESEYLELTGWMNRSYAREKGITEREVIKRRVFALFFSLHYNLGCRNKEILGLKWKDISINPMDTEEGKRKNRVFTIDAKNSKTGRGRNIVVADVVSKLDRIKSWYKKIGVVPAPDDFVFINLTQTKSGKNIPYEQPAMAKRLKEVMEKSGLGAKLRETGRHINLYGARHFYATARLMRGVSMQDLAMNMGTSTAYIESTYSHLTTLMRSSEITKGQGYGR